MMPFHKYFLNLILVVKFIAFHLIKVLIMILSLKEPLGQSEVHMVKYAMYGVFVILLI